MNVDTNMAVAVVAATVTKTKAATAVVLKDHLCIRTYH